MSVCCWVASLLFVVQQRLTRQRIEKEANGLRNRRAVHWHQGQLVRRGMSGGCVLRRGSAPGRVAEVRVDQRRVLREREVGPRPTYRAASGRAVLKMECLPFGP